jgi:hypothetical protein
MVLPVLQQKLPFWKNMLGFILKERFRLKYRIYIVLLRVGST